MKIKNKKNCNSSCDKKNAFFEDVRSAIDLRSLSEVISLAIEIADDIVLKSDGKSRKTRKIF